LRQKDRIDEATGIVSGSCGLSRGPRGLQPAVVQKTQSIKGGLSPRILLASLGFTLIYFGDRLVLYAGVVAVAAAFSLVYSYTLEHVLRGDDLSVRHRAGMFEGLLEIGSMVGPFLAGFIAEFSFAHAFSMVAVVSLFFAIVLRVSETSTHRLSLSLKLRDPD